MFFSRFKDTGYIGVFPSPMLPAATTTTAITQMNMPLIQLPTMTTSTSVLDLKTESEVMLLKPRLNKKLCRVASFNAIAA